MTAAAPANISVLPNMRTLPAKFYHDPPFYEAERKAIFFDQWLVFGHESMLNGPGKHVTKNIAGWSVFVIRDKNNELKAFHNVCRHRAAPLLDEGCGKADILRCRYHGWVYDTDGQLRRAPNFGGDEKSLCDKTALFPVNVKSWQGLVFICMSETPPSFEAALGDMPDLVRGLDLPGFYFHSTASHKINCNWKAYIENYIEGYHIPTIHPELNRELDMNTYQVQPGNRTARHVSDTRGENPVSDGLWLWLWPYAAFNVYKNGMNLELAIPTGPETVELSYTYFFRDPSTLEENQRTIDTSFALTQEDIAVCELVQKNLRAGMYQRGELSPRHETGLAYFQDLIRQTLNVD